MVQTFPKNPETQAEALALCAEILQGVESRQSSLSATALKVSRLAHLLGDTQFKRIMDCECSGYPTTVRSMSPEVWNLAVLAGRKIQFGDPQCQRVKYYVYVESIRELEEQVDLSRSLLSKGNAQSAQHSSSNLLKRVCSRAGHHKTNYSIDDAMSHGVRRLERRRTLIHRYVASKFYALKFSGISDEVFTRIRQRVDATIGNVLRDGAQMLSSVYENLRSINPVDWSNAVHTCRRILQDLADAVYPATDKVKTVQIDRHTRTIKLGQEHYINRIIAFVEEKNCSERFQELVGSHIRFLGDRLDSVFSAAQKGSHTTIVSKEEADRYVVYTYLLVGDVLSLM